MFHAPMPRRVFMKSARIITKPDPRQYHGQGTPVQIDPAPSCEADFSAPQAGLAVLPSDTGPGGKTGRWPAGAVSCPWDWWPFHHGQPEVGANSACSLTDARARARARARALLWRTEGGGRGGTPPTTTQARRQVDRAAGRTSEAWTSLDEILDARPPAGRWGPLSGQTGGGWWARSGATGAGEGGYLSPTASMLPHSCEKKMMASGGNWARFSDVRTCFVGR